MTEEARRIRTEVQRKADAEAEAARLQARGGASLAPRPD